MNSSSSHWSFHHWEGSAARFHELDLESGRGVWWCDVEAPALIVGSTQSMEDIDSDAAGLLGVDVVRRRSGGGAVFVHPTDAVWLDITIDRNDDLWVDDITQSMLWLGEVFVQAFSPWVDGHVYRDAFLSGSDGRTVCFASSSPGEVFVGPEKLVGISQRRGRDGARMQCIVYRQWIPSMWVSAMASPDSRRCATELPVATLTAPSADIVAAFVAALPR